MSTPSSAGNAAIVCIGEPMYEFSQLPDDRQRWLQGFGGDTANAAVAAARQGARVAYYTRLGDDEFGREFLALWRTEQVDASAVQIDKGAHTAAYFVSHGPQGHVFSYLRKGSAASRMRPADLPLGLIRGARFLHASGISQAISADACDTVFAAMDAARSAGVQVSYDTNLRLRLWPLPRARAVIAASIAQCDVLFVSLEEGEQLCGRGEPEQVLAWCHGRGVRRVALKLGARGVIGSDGQRSVNVPGHAVQAVDATGAGDCFAGSFLARLAAGDDFWHALHYANAAAALTCTGYGAVAPLPRPEAVRRLLDEAAAKR
jgi:2-dehydro-3-deoxygluconokinase